MATLNPIGPVRTEEKREAKIREAKIREGKEGETAREEERDRAQEGDSTHPPYI